jgi:hypothetical protein
MQRAGLVKPDGARNRPGGRAEEECSAAELYIAYRHDRTHVVEYSHQ